MKNFLKKVFPLAIVLIGMVLPISNIWRAAIFFSVTILFLRPNKKEIFLWAFANFFFVINDIGAIKNNFFQFTEPDLLALPYWEYVAWGFWILYLCRNLPSKFPTNIDLRTLLMAVLFTMCFGLIPQKNLILVSTLSILIVYLLMFPVNYNFFWIFRFALIGGIVEAIGLYFNHWAYPKTDLIFAIVQFLVMWAGVGIWFRNLFGPFLVDFRIKRSVYRNVFSQTSTKKIDLNLSGDSGLKYSFNQYVKMSTTALEQTNSRKSIECAREALASAQTPIERSKAHLLLSQNYRMVVQMRNARKEIERAFAELGLEIPRNFILQTLKYVPAFIMSYLRPPSLDESVELIKLKVDLYEEIGLAGYYLREETLMFQASIRAYVCAAKLGPSLEMIKWMGATTCILILKSQHRLASKLKSKARGIMDLKNDPVMNLEWAKWECLFTDYEGFSLKSAQLLENILCNFKNELVPQDFRLCALTLSCNYLIRGHFLEAIRSIDLIFNQKQKQEHDENYFSNYRPHVDWYQIGALGFLKPSEDWTQQLRSSQAIFSQTDREKWAITQYLGQRLFAIYASGNLDPRVIDEIEERFSELKLSPTETFLEASFFWIGLALVRLDQFSRGDINRSVVKKILSQLGQLYSHPILDQFYKILQQRYEILTNKRITPLPHNFSDELFKSQNLLAQQELRRNHVWEKFKIKNCLTNADRKYFEDELAALQWSQYQKMIENWLDSLNSNLIQKELA